MDQLERLGQLWNENLKLLSTAKARRKLDVERRCLSNLVRLAIQIDEAVARLNPQDLTVIFKDNMTHG